MRLVTDRSIVKILPEKESAIPFAMYLVVFN
jgi:hypothetical protein